MWSYNYTTHPDELYHHGIKGQKWGVRRYQNADGSLTEAGKKHYGSIGRLTGMTSIARAVYRHDAGYKNASEKKKKALDKNFEAAENNIIYGNRGAKRIERDMGKGDSLSKARFKETGRSLLKSGAVTLAALSVADLISNGSNSALGKAGRAVKSGAGYVKDAASKGFFNLTYDAASGSFVKNVRSNVPSIGGTTVWNTAKDRGSKYIKDAVSYVKSGASKTGNAFKSAANERNALRNINSRLQAEQLLKNGGQVSKEELRRLGLI